MELYLPVFAALIVTAYGCSAPGRDRSDASLEEKVYKSQYVAYGTVLLILPDPVYGGKDVHAAVVSVKCTYKGGMLPINITVVGAGKMPGCPEAILHKMTDYILFIKAKNDRYYDVEFTPILGDPQMIDEILIVCDMALTYTKGSVAEKEQGCPDIFDEDDCVRYVPPVDNVNQYTPAPNITTEVISDKTSDLEMEAKPEPEADGKKIGNGKGGVEPAIGDDEDDKKTGQSAIVDNGNGKELISLSGFLLFTCTTLAALFL